MHVRSADGYAHDPAEGLEAHRRLLGELGGRYAEVTGADPARALADFARAENATQLVLGASGRSRWGEIVHGSIINRVIRDASRIDVHVVISGGQLSRVAIGLPPSPLGTGRSASRATSARMGARHHRHRLARRRHVGIPIQSRPVRRAALPPTRGRRRGFCGKAWHPPRPPVPSSDLSGSWPTSSSLPPYHSLRIESVDIVALVVFLLDG